MVTVKFVIRYKYNYFGLHSTSTVIKSELLRKYKNKLYLTNTKQTFTKTTVNNQYSLNISHLQNGAYKNTHNFYHAF